MDAKELFGLVVAVAVEAGAEAEAEAQGGEQYLRYQYY